MRQGHLALLRLRLARYNVAKSQNNKACQIKISKRLARYNDAKYQNNKTCQIKISERLARHNVEKSQINKPYKDGGSTVVLLSGWMGWVSLESCPKMFPWERGLYL